MSEQAGRDAAIGEALDQVFAELVRDVLRSKSLLNEAIPALVRSFDQLKEDLSTHARELGAISLQLQGDQGANGIVSQVRGVLDIFVRDMLAVSHNSMRLVGRVEALSGDVDQIVADVSHIESLAKSTRLIALNARIEAHRVGEAGKTFRVVADEVKALADDAHEFSGQIRDVVRGTHASLAEAKEAVTGLASHDLNALLEGQQEVLLAMERLDATSNRVSNSLGHFNERIEEAVRAMHFERALGEVLDAMGERLASVRELWTHWRRAQETDAPHVWREVDRLLGVLGARGHTASGPAMEAADELVAPPAMQERC